MLEWQEEFNSKFKYKKCNSGILSLYLENRDLVECIRKYLGKHNIKFSCKSGLIQIEKLNNTIQELVKMDWEVKFNDKFGYERSTNGYAGFLVDQNIVEYVEKYIGENFVKVKCKDGMIQIERVKYEKFLSTS